MKRSYHLDVVFLPLNIINGGAGRVGQGRFLKERIPEMILIDYSDKDYLPNQNPFHI